MATAGVNPDGSERKRLDQLPRVAQLTAGWATPAARDFKSEQATEEYTQKREEHPRGKALSHQATWTSGQTPTGTTAKTGKTAAFRLNPAFSLWLMGYPLSWALVGMKTLLLKKAQYEDFRKALLKSLEE